MIVRAAGWHLSAKPGNILEFNECRWTPSQSDKQAFLQCFDTVGWVI